MIFQTCLIPASKKPKANPTMKHLCIKEICRAVADVISGETNVIIYSLTNAQKRHNSQNFMKTVSNNLSKQCNLKINDDFLRVWGCDLGMLGHLLCFASLYIPTTFNLYNELLFLRQAESTIWSPIIISNRRKNQIDLECINNVARADFLPHLISVFKVGSYQNNTIHSLIEIVWTQEKSKLFFFISTD